MKRLESKNLFKCYVYDDDLKESIYTVVYKIKDDYYDMRLVSSPFDLSVVGRLGNRLSYRVDGKKNSYYGTERKIIAETLQPFYSDGREFFTIKELIVDMV